MQLNLLVHHATAPLKLWPCGTLWIRLLLLLLLTLTLNIFRGFISVGG